MTDAGDGRFCAAGGFGLRRSGRRDPSSCSTAVPMTAPSATLRTCERGNTPRRARERAKPGGLPSATSLPRRSTEIPAPNARSRSGGRNAGPASRCRDIAGIHWQPRGQHDRADEFIDSSDLSAHRFSRIVNRGETIVCLLPHCCAVRSRPATGGEDARLGRATQAQRPQGFRVMTVARFNVAGCTLLPPFSLRLSSRPDDSKKVGRATHFRGDIKSGDCRQPTTS